MSAASDAEEELSQAIDRLLSGQPAAEQPQGSGLGETARALSEGVGQMEPRREFLMAARVRFLARAAEHFGQQPRPLLFRLSLAMRAAAAALALLLVIGTGTVVTAESSVPGSPLYPVKLAHENVRRQLTPQPVDRAVFESGLAERRVHELDALVARGEKSRFLEQANAIRLQVRGLRQAVEQVQAVHAAGRPVPERKIAALRLQLQAVREAPEALHLLLQAAPPEMQPRLRQIALETAREYELLTSALRGDQQP